MRRVHHMVATMFALILGLAGSTADAAVTPAPGPAPETRAHVLFDDTTGPRHADVASGGAAQPLTHPRIPLGPVGGGSAPHVSQAALPDPEVLGFAQSGEVASGSWTSDLRFDLLSTVAYFGINLYPDGSIVNDYGLQVYWSAQTTSLINAAHAAGDRVVLTVKVFDDQTISILTGNETNRQHAIQSIIGQISSRNADGVNIDFEGFNSSVAPFFTLFIHELHDALRGQILNNSYLTVDTYASSAWGGTMFDVPGLQPYVDAFMVMAYDITSPASSNAGPVAPLNGSTYADTNTMAHYLSQVPASQVILGVPYYGYKWSTTNNSPQAPAAGYGSADTYSAALDDLSCAQSLSAHFDSTFYSPWASWYSPASGDPCGGNRGSWRELYYENPQSLGGKYDLVNSDHLRGIGIWALGYDSGHAELWNEISSKFAVSHGPQVQVTALAATQSSQQYQLQWQLAPNSIGALYYIVYVRDGSAGWQWWTTTGAMNTTLFGQPNHTYSFYVEAVAGVGLTSGGPSGSGQTSTTIASNATSTTAFHGLYVLDGYGNLRPNSSPPVATSGTWSGWDIARGVTVDDALGGLVLDGFGGLHPFGDSPGAGGYTYWPGWDIAVGVTSLSTSGGGYVLDAWGGLHPYTLNGRSSPPAPHGSAYWGGWRIAKAAANLPDGSGGVVLDGWGGLHPFTVSGGPAVSPPVITEYWHGWDIARSVVMMPGSNATHYSGFVLDGWGGFHPFATAGTPMPTQPPNLPYWAGWDIARSIVLMPGSASAGWVTDGWGGVHPFGGAPGVMSPQYSPGLAIAHNAGVN